MVRRNNCLLISTGWGRQLNVNGQSRVCSWTIVFVLIVVTWSLMFSILFY